MAKQETAVKAPVDVVAKYKVLNGFVLDSKTALAKAIGEWRENGVKRQEITNRLMLQALVHAHLHGDTTFATSIINGAASGDMVLAMKRWFNRFAPIQWKNEQKNEAGEVIAPAQFKKTGANDKKYLHEDEKEGSALLKEAFAVKYYEDDNRRNANASTEYLASEKVEGSLKRLIKDITEGLEKNTIPEGAERTFAENTLKELTKLQKRAHLVVVARKEAEADAPQAQAAQAAA